MGDWTGMASSPTGDGFFLTSSNGGVAGCGDALPVGGLTATTLAAPVVGMAATSDGKGYWLVAADGGVFAFGDAAFEGSLGGTHLNAPVVGIAATRRRRAATGWWHRTAASSPSVTPPSRARWAGTHLNAPVVGMSATPDGAGYWLAAADGGVFAFGTAPFEARWPTGTWPPRSWASPRIRPRLPADGDARPRPSARRSPARPRPRVASGEPGSL